MTIEQFRNKHSLLIEHYQYIEMHLEGIYASICAKEFQEGLNDVEKTNLYKLLVAVEDLEKQKNITVFTKEEKRMLREIFQRRNYWVHNCYTEMVFDRKTDDIKNQTDVDALEMDIQNAEAIRQRLYELKTEVMHNAYDNRIN